jgi:ABC-type multidrug transport system fused ATPase/permease subunit
MAANPQRPEYDPPDLAFAATARALLRLWLTERRLIAAGLAAAFTYTALSLTIPALMQRAVDRAVVPHRLERLWPYAAAMLALSCVRFGANFSRRYVTVALGLRLETRLRDRLYAAYLAFPRGFYDRHATGQLVSRATTDLVAIRYFVGEALVNASQNVMMILGSSVLLVLVDARLAIWALLPMPLIAFSGWLFGHRVMPLSRIVQARKADLTEAADEGVIGMEVMQAFGREPDVRARFAARAASTREAVVHQARVEARYVSRLHFLPMLGVAAVTLAGGRAVIGGEISLGDFVLFNTILLQLASPLGSMGWLTNVGQRALAAASRTFAWIDRVPRLEDPKRPRRLRGTRAPALRFEDVAFAYADGPMVLDGVDLAAGPGEVLAVCGSTGSGKTTLLSLVSRQYDPARGRVLIGGVDARRLAFAELRTVVAVVTQRPILLSGSLRENIIAGRAGVPATDVGDACRTAGVDVFLDDLPDGWETSVGERGTNLSGGQRQRVALARALAGPARLIVLDDPLSAVDVDTESLVVERLRERLRDRTVLLASQRLSTVRLADRAAVLVDGRIAEAGRPDTLLGRDGAFTALFGDQVVAA